MWPQCLLVLRLPAPFVPHSSSLSPATARQVLSTPVPVLPLLPVWMCLFSISLVSVPLAVRFSVSSGCARRCSVFTYAAILVPRHQILNSILYCTVSQRKFRTQSPHSDHICRYSVQPKYSMKNFLCLAL